MKNIFKNQQGAVPILITLAAVGLITFLLISNTFNFKDSLFNTLFPKPPSSASSGIGFINPTKGAIIYHEPVPTGGEFNVTIYDRGTASKGSLMSGQKLQYILLDEWEGLANYSAPVTSATAPTCTIQTGFAVTKNQINLEINDFCNIHNSIIEGLKPKGKQDNNKKIDLNIDGIKDANDAFASEDWFIHNKDGNRKYVAKSLTDWQYRPNPKNVNVRKYFIGRLIREMKGGKASDGTAWAATGMDGIYLDNIALEWNNITNTNASYNASCPNNDCDPKEFTNSADYAKAVFEFVQAIVADTGWKELKKQLWGNMIHSDAGWSHYDPYLDGALKENFVLDWGKGPYSKDKIETQLTQAESWMTGNYFVAVAQAPTGGSQEQSLLAQAAYLLVVKDVNKGSFRFADNDEYAKYFGYPELNSELGYPDPDKPTRYLKPGFENIWRRDFESGCVELDLNTMKGIIKVVEVDPNTMEWVTNNECTPPIPTPSPDASPGSTSSAAPSAPSSPLPSGSTDSVSVDLLYVVDSTPPTGSITSPIYNAIVPKATPTPIKANMSDATAGVKYVKFFVGDVLQCQIYSIPYECLWTPPNTMPKGGFILTAEATDNTENLPNNLGNKFTTSPVIVKFR